jgi:hypothetical protein
MADCKEPHVSRPTELWSVHLPRKGQSRVPSTRLPRALRTLAHEAVVAGDGPHPLGQLGAVTVRCGASSFSSAVPPACHKQRSPAVSSGQSRSLREARWAGLNGSDLGWGRTRNCMACKGSDRSALGLTLPLTMASMPRARARATRRWVASFDRPPRAARLRVCPGRSRPAAGR